MNMLKRFIAGLVISAVMLGVVDSAQAAIIHYYDFASAATDSVGGENGVLFNGATVSGGVLNLDGSDDYVEFSSHLVPTAESYTVAFFAQQNSSQSGLFVEMISQGTAGGTGFYIGKNSDDTVRVSDAWIWTGIPFPTVGVLHHYALTVEKSSSKSSVYIDGTLAGQANVVPSAYLAGSNTRLGNQFSPYAEYFHGIIDDVRIYDSVLTATDIANLASPTSAIPEPSSILLLVIGFAGLTCIKGVGFS
ncbi:MAG: LamG domain-containing protein [Candidatus Methylumidiphilus sp.]